MPVPSVATLDARAPQGFARLSPGVARCALAIISLASVAAVAVTLSPLRSGFADHPGRRPSDLDLFTAQVRRMQAGAGYYAAAGQEMRPRGYPTASVFNWRTPLPLALLGWLPEPRLAQALLAGIAVGVALWGFAWVSDAWGVRYGLGAMLCFSGAALPCVLGGLYVSPELWSGMLVALSIVAYARDQRKVGGTAGMAALFCRELAGLYVLIAIGLAVRERRWREVVAWLVGLAAYAIFFAIHVAHVWQQQGPAEPAHERGWIALGGAPFVISTAQMNAYLLLLPQWVTALALVLALVGCAGWSQQARLGLTLAGYVAAFSIVGQSFNQYWGLLYAPLLCFALPASLPALRDLYSAATRPTASSTCRQDSLARA